MTKWIFSLCLALAFIAVSACSSGGDSAPAAPTLSAPSNVATMAGDASVTVSWDALPNVSGYEVFYATAPGVDTSASPSVTTAATQVLVPGLTNGTTYYFVVVANNGLIESAASTEVSATPNAPAALPSGVMEIEAGFTIEEIQTGLAFPAKIAAAADGRIFFNELRTGNIRVIDANGDLVATPFATVADLATNVEQGLLGICLDNDFMTNGFVYVQACIQTPGVQRVIRFTATGNVGGSETIVVDNLPMATVHNAGALKMASDGTLFSTTGDIGDANMDETNVALVDGQLAGRVLRYNSNGTIPADNPDPASPEYARGLRNPFGIALHPSEDAIFVTENGPNNNDELNFIQAGKNYTWPVQPMSLPGAQVGFQARLWPDVIVPTGITWFTGNSFGADYDDNLFFGAYDEEVIWRFEMSGPVLADIDAEHEFIKFVKSGTDNKPLDVIQAPDGSLLISTFTSIYRVTKAP